VTDENSKDSEIKKNEPDKKGGIGEQLQKDKKLKLTVDRVVEYLLKKNYDVKQALLEYRGISSGLMNYRSKYDFGISGNIGYSYKENPNKSSVPFSGDSTRTANYSAGLSKKFSTGTSLQAGLTGLYQNNVGASLFGSAKGYQTGIKVEIAQDLLKNAFGVTDRMNEKIISNSEKAGKKNVRQKLAVLLVDALIGYWNASIAEKNLDTAKESLKSTIDIKNLVMRKMKLGLSEREEILDWNGKVLEGKNFRDNAEKILFDARLSVLRILNLDPKTDFEIGKTFKRTAPVIIYERALKDAFLKRVDWSNSKIDIKNGMIQYRIAGYDAFPTLRLKAGYGNNDYDSESYLKTMNNIRPEFTAGLELSMPLENTAADVKLRDARLLLMKNHVAQKKLEKEIRDQIASSVKQCDVSFKVYEQTKKSRQYRQNYYFQVLKKFKRGRYSALQLKVALDGYILSRQMELQSLVDYNIALIRRDLARNVIFENLGIDIDRILKRVEN